MESTSKAAQYLTTFVHNATPQFAFTIVYKTPDTSGDIFVEARNLQLDNLPKTKTIHHVLCGEYNIILLNTSFTVPWIIEFMES